MTLIAALEGLEGLVLAADSRGTIGDPRGLTAINDVQRKLFKLTDYCGITISGSSELAARIIDRLTGHLKKQNVDAKDVDAILASTADMMKQEYTSWFGPRPWVSAQPLIDQRPVIVFILAGYTFASSSAPMPRIYLLNSQVDFAPQLCPTGFMIAGIPQYATYLLHRLYDRQMGLRSLQALAAYLITETASQDPKVGGPITMASITPKDGLRELDAGTIDAIVKANEEQSRKLRQFFFTGGTS